MGMFCAMKNTAVAVVDPSLPSSSSQDSLKWMPIRCLCGGPMVEDVQQNLCALSWGYCWCAGSRRESRFFKVQEGYCFKSAQWKRSRMIPHWLYFTILFIIFCPLLLSQSDISCHPSSDFVMPPRRAGSIVGSFRSISSAGLAGCVFQG